MMSADRVRWADPRVGGDVDGQPLDVPDHPFQEIDQSLSARVNHPGRF